MGDKGRELQNIRDALIQKLGDFETSRAIYFAKIEQIMTVCENLFMQVVDHIDSSEAKDPDEIKLLQSARDNIPLFRAFREQILQVNAIFDDFRILKIYPVPEQKR